MAQPYSTGPVLVWISISQGTSGFLPVFLGTAEEFPRQLHRPRHAEFHRDGSGQQPFDASFQGADALLDITLTRWDEVTAQRLERLPAPIGGTKGQYSADDVGTLLALESVSFPVWLRYSGKNRLAMADLPDGYRYPQCVFRGPWSNQTGSRAMKRQIIFQAYPRYDRQARTFTLYDYDMSALPQSGDAIA